MKQIQLLLLCLVALVLTSCGGGGGAGGGTTTRFNIVGRVVNISTGSVPDPVVSIQAGDRTTTSSASDGSFVLAAPAGTTSVTVIYKIGSADLQTSVFSIAPLAGDIDAGDLIVGPQKITVQGTVKQSSDGNPVAGATVRFGGKSATTNSSGVYTISEVGYDPGNIAAFLSLEGTVTQTGFFSATFSPVAGASSGVVNIDDVFLTTDSGTTPPGLPYNLEGVVTNGVPGVIVRVLSGTMLIRQGSLLSPTTKAYGFWLEPGTYNVQAFNPATSQTSTSEVIVIPDSVTTIKKDLTLQ